MSDKNIFSDFEVISTYTRKQAIEDGVLIDVTPMAKEAGFKWHTAVTSGLWYDYIIPSEELIKQAQSIEGRLWDVLNVLRMEVRNSQGAIINFKVIFLMGDSKKKYVDLKCIAGPGDKGEPVLTIMLPEED